MGTEKKMLMKGRDIAIRCLERQGVDVLFAYPGGFSLELHQALQNSTIRVGPLPQMVTPVQPAKLVCVWQPAGPVQPICLPVLPTHTWIPFHWYVLPVRCRRI